MPRRPTQSERRSAKESSCKVIQPLVWKGPGCDTQMLEGLSKEDLQSFRTWMDFFGGKAYWVLFFGFFWCSWSTYLISMLLYFETHSVLQLMAQALELEKNLPAPWCVYFEETSIAINQCAVQRYVKPFARVGNTAATGVILCAWVLTNAAACGEFVIPAAAAFSRVCLALRAWRRTRHQYERKLLQLKAMSGQHCIDKVIEDSTFKMITEIFPVAYWDSGMLPMELRVARSRSLREGSTYCLQLINDMLIDVSRIRPMPLARKKSQLETSNTQLRLISWSKTSPLGEQWRIVDAVLNAADAILDIDERKNDGNAFPSTTERQVMMTNVKRARKQGELFEKLIVETLGPQYVISSMVTALIEVDRTEVRRIRAESGPTDSLQEASGSDQIIEHPMPAQNTNGDVPISTPLVGVVDASAFENHFGAERCIDDDIINPPDVEEIQHECIVCFERPAEIVFSKCGHLTYCKNCRRKALRQEWGCEWHSLESYARRLRRPMNCPVCRATSATVVLSKYQGVVFKC